MKRLEDDTTEPIIEHSLTFSRRRGSDIDSIKAAIEFLRNGRLNPNLSLKYESRELFPDTYMEAIR